MHENALCMSLWLVSYRVLVSDTALSKEQEQMNFCSLTISFTHIVILLPSEQLQVNLDAYSNTHAHKEQNYNSNKANNNCANVKVTAPQ